MKRILMFAAIALPLLFACVSALPAQAQTFTKPAGAITGVVPNYNVTVGIWATVTAVGGCLCVFEQQPNGTWILSGSGGTEYADYNFNGDVASMGATGWINQNGLQGVNITLASRFPAVTPPPPTDAYGQVNTALGAGFQIITSPSKNVPVVVGK